MAIEGGTTGDRVGLGVDLVGGEQTLAQLQSIRKEMEAIAALGGRTSGSSSVGASTRYKDDTRAYKESWQVAIKAKEDAEIASIRRIAKARADSQRVYTNNEIDTLATGKNSKTELNNRINQRAKEIAVQTEREKQAELTRISVEAEQTRQNKILAIQERAAQRRARVQELSQGPQIQIDPAQRRLFKAARRDPAAIADPQTQEWRDEYALTLRAAGVQRDLITKIQRERNAIADLRRKLVTEPTEPRGSFRRYSAVSENIEGGVAFADRAATRGTPEWSSRIIHQYKDEQLAQNTSAMVLSERKRTVKNLGDTERFTADFFKSAEGQALLKGGVSGKNGVINIPTPGGPTPPRGGGGRGGSGGGGRTPNLNDPKGLFNEKGFFTSGEAVGRITRNILLYEVISRATYGLTAYIEKSLQAAKASVDMGQALIFATKAAGGNVYANQQLVDSLGQYGLSRQQGREAVTQAARLAQSRPGDTAQLVQTVTNIAASRGQGVGEVGQLIDEIRQGRPRLIEEYLNKRPEDIYKEYAAVQLRNRTTTKRDNAGLYLDTQETKASEPRIKGLNEEIKSYVQNLTEAQKANALFDYILGQSSHFQDAAAQRADTLAGRLDKLSAVWANNEENLGLFITDLKVVSDLIGKLSDKAGILDSLRKPLIQRTGQGGTLSSSDIEANVTAQTTGTRATLLNAVNNYGPTALATGLGLAGAGLFGRRQAQGTVRLDAFRTNLTRLEAELGEGSNAASAEAVRIAKDAKPGLIKSVATGMKRLTIGMSDSILGLGGISNAQLSAQNRGLIYGPQGPYSPYVANPRTQSLVSGIGTAGGVAGGLAGGLIGGEIGNLVASQITSNQIVATGITILGAVAGTAAGSALGSAAGGAVGGAITNAGSLTGLLGGSVGAAGLGLTAGLVAGAGLIGYGIGSLIEPLGGKHRDDDLRLQQENARQALLNTRATDFQQNLREDRVRFFDPRNPGGGLLNINAAQKAGIDTSSYNTTGSIVFDKAPQLKTIAEIDEHEKSILLNVALSNEERQKAIALDEQDKKILKEYGTLDEAMIKDLDDYRASAAERERVRKDKERQQREKDVSEISNALAKLRDFQQGSFRVVGDVAQQITGDDNPYTKVLAEQITLGERMQQQWGFLGTAAVKYFSQVEQAANNRALNKIEFSTYKQATDLRNKAESEVSARDAPGLSTRDELYLNIQKAIVDQATEVPKLWASASEALGRTVSPLATLRNQIKELQVSSGVGAVANGNQFRGFSSGAKTATFIAKDGSVVTQLLDSGKTDDYARYQQAQIARAGQSPELRQRSDELYAQSILSLGSAKDFRQAGLGGIYARAAGIQAGSFQRNVNEARQKAELQAQEDERLNKQLREDESFRNRQLEAGRNASDVGQEADALLLSRTEGVPSKDLNYQQFSDRQAALRRTAERTVAQQKDAQQAITETRNFQNNMLNVVAGIREALAGGSLSMLVQVQNDTQARIDQNTVQNLTENGVPLDQRGVKTNPLTALDKYKRVTTR